MTVTDDVAPDSVYASLRQLREQLKEDATVELELPGYQGELKARYRSLSFEELNRLSQQGQKHPGGFAKKQLALMADLLVTACIGILMRQPNGSYEDLVTADDQPLGYDEHLASAMGIQTPDGEPLTPRTVVYEVFGGLSSPNTSKRVVTHGEALSTWQADVDVKADDELSGESNGTE